MSAIVTSIWRNPQLASAELSTIEIHQCNIKELYWMVKEDRWRKKQQSDGYKSIWRCVLEGCCWSAKTGGLKGDHWLEGCSGWLVIKARELQDERIINIYLEKSVVVFISLRTAEIHIKTFQFSTGIECNMLTMETKSYHYIWIGKLFYIYYVMSTFCTWVML
jgi:hypothetical protein